MGGGRLWGRGGVLVNSKKNVLYSFEKWPKIMETLPFTSTDIPPLLLANISN